MRKINVTLLIGLAVLLVGSTAQAQNEWFVNGTCAAEGTYGFQVVHNSGTNTVFVQDDTPDHEGSYRMQFQFHVGSMVMPHRGKYYIGVALQDDAGQRPFQVVISNNNTNGVKVWAQTAHNNTVIYATDKVSITDPTSWVTLQVEWRQSVGGGTDDGLVRVTNVTEGTSAEITGFRNSAYTVGRARIGLTGRATVPAGGYHCWDEFESYRTLAP